MERKNLNKSIIITLLSVLLIAVMVIVYVNTRPQPADKANQEVTEDGVTAVKTITVRVVIPNENPMDYVIKTDADFLRQALDQEKLIEGEEGDFGFYITGVNGRLADEGKREWWCITKGGEEVFTGVNEIVLQDDDQYELTLMNY